MKKRLFLLACMFMAMTALNVRAIIGIIEDDIVIVPLSPTSAEAVALDVAALSNHVDGAFAKLDGSNISPLTTNFLVVTDNGGSADHPLGSYGYAGQVNGKPSYTNGGVTISWSLDADGGENPGWVESYNGNYDTEDVDYPWQLSSFGNIGLVMQQGRETDLDAQEAWQSALGLSDAVAAASDWSAFTNAGRWVPCPTIYVTSGAAATTGPTNNGATAMFTYELGANNDRVVGSLPAGATAIRMLLYFETNNMTSADGAVVDLVSYYINTSGGLAFDAAPRLTAVATNSWCGYTNVLNSAALAADVRNATVFCRGTNFQSVVTNIAPFWLYKLEAYVPNCFGESCPVE